MFTNQLLRRSTLVLGLVGALSLAACGGPATGSAHSPATPPAPASQQATPAGEDVADSVPLGGGSRNYDLHLPPAATRLHPTPVVLLFHGAGDQPARMASRTHFADVADKNGFAVILPHGSNAPGLGLGWTVPGEVTGAPGGDDVAYVRAILDSAGPKYQLDTTSVLATGLSNGGEVSQYLGCELADRLAGIAPVSGPMPRAVMQACTPARPLSVLEIHGTADPVSNIAGGGIDASVADTVAFWEKADRCPAPAATDSLPDTAHDGTTVTRSVATGCAAGTSVALYTVVGGGHGWPGGDQLGNPAQFGPTSKQFDASQLVWDFFKTARQAAGA